MLKSVSRIEQFIPKAKLECSPAWVSCRTAMMFISFVSVFTAENKQFSKSLSTTAEGILHSFNNLATFIHISCLPQNEIKDQNASVSLDVCFVTAMQSHDR